MGIYWLRLRLSPNQALQFALALADLLRIGAWYVFLIVLIVWPGSVSAFTQVRSLIAVAAILIIFGIVANVSYALGWSALGNPASLARIDWLALAIFALVLLETLFRNLPVESRWNIKPFCIGLGGAFAFDIYLYSDAVLFNRVDVDAFSIRVQCTPQLIPVIVDLAPRSGKWISEGPDLGTRHFSRRRCSLSVFTCSPYRVPLIYVRSVWWRMGARSANGFFCSGLFVLVVLAVSVLDTRQLRFFWGSISFGTATIIGKNGCVYPNLVVL